MLVIVIIGIVLLIGAGARLLAVRWFESANRQRHPRGASGIIIGAEPIELPADGDAGVLLIHGFGDTPQTLRPVCRSIACARVRRGRATFAGTREIAR